MGVSPYTDLARPPLREAVLRRALLTPGGLWTDLRVVARTGSTNADLAAAARAGEAGGRVLVAESQLAGRGRLDRAWVAPPRSAITVSVLLRPAATVPPARLAWLPALAGVALAEAVGRIAVVDAVLKWPNDLLVRPAATTTAGYGKCAGVLAEVVCDAVVVGVGLNVSQHPDELPRARNADVYPATSLALAGAACTDRDPLLRAVLRAFEQWYRRWEDAAGDPDTSGLREAYRGRCATLGHDVAVAVPGGDVLRGEARDIDPDGRLVVATSTGERSLAAGDVLRVR